nr:Biomphalaria glabrata matrilin-3-like [Biomphalaria glabrata]
MSELMTQANPSTSNLFLAILMLVIAHRLLQDETEAGKSIFLVRIFILWKIHLCKNREYYPCNINKSK